MSTEASARIRWEPTEYNGFVGYCTDDASRADWVFRVWKTGTGKWQLDSTLPGQFGRHLYDDNDPAPLKAEAERWLEEFISSLGAVFTGEIAADLRARANEMETYTDGGEEGRHDRSMFATGMRRAADLIERGDQPAAPDPSPAAVPAEPRED